MKVAVIGGTGYVGLVTGIGLASVGHNVICADIDEGKICDLNKGILPIYEKGLIKLLKKARKKNAITFTTSVASAVKSSNIIIVAVGTPENRYGDADMSQIFKALKAIAANINSYKVIAVKSTVPVGTCEMAESVISDNLTDMNKHFDVVSNPEFLREGSAVKDFLYPDRIVVGASSTRALEMMQKLYSYFDCPFVSMDQKSSEMVKYACNSYLAARLSFINEISEISGSVGADIKMVIEGMKYDERIGGHYLNPGPGFGGPCLSKDVKSLISFSRRSNADTSVLSAVLARNKIQIDNIVSNVDECITDRKNAKVAILGLSFKANTDDMRNSPSIWLVKALIDNGYDNIRVYDPIVKNIKHRINDFVIHCNSIEDAARDCDCLIIMTEWTHFKNMELDAVYNVMSSPYIIDTRNILDSNKANETGFVYIGNGIRKKAIEKTILPTSVNA